MNIAKTIKNTLFPNNNPDIKKAYQYQRTHLPTLWLLGKTGSGKSSIISTLLSNNDIEVGNGFQPCTKASFSFNYPSEQPLVRMLDTRGVGEVDYDPLEDIAICEKQSNALLIVMKVDEPEQSSLISALSVIKKSKNIQKVLIIHTASGLVECSEELNQCIAHNQEQVDKVFGRPLDSITIDFDVDADTYKGLELLEFKIAEMLPILTTLQDKEIEGDIEQKNFNKLKKEILWYSGTAGATDVIPGVGLVSVPLIQAKMLHSLASHYGLKWNTKSTMEFLSCIGSGFAMNYAAQFCGKQLVKFIPYYGQTVGAVSAGLMSYCFTYALGRVASKYMYSKSIGEPIDNEGIKTAYAESYSSILKVMKND